MGTHFPRALSHYAEREREREGGTPPDPARGRAPAVFPWTAQPSAPICLTRATSSRPVPDPTTVLLLLLYLARFRVKNHPKPPEQQPGPPPLIPSLVASPPRDPPRRSSSSHGRRVLLLPPPPPCFSFPPRSAMRRARAAAMASTTTGNHERRPAFLPLIHCRAAPPLLAAATARRHPLQPGSPLPLMLWRMRMSLAKWIPYINLVKSHLCLCSLGNVKLLWRSSSPRLLWRMEIALARWIPYVLALDSRELLEPEHNINFHPRVPQYVPQLIVYPSMSPSSCTR